MKISQFIEQLEDILHDEGDIEVANITHYDDVFRALEVEPTVVEHRGKRYVIVD